MKILFLDIDGVMNNDELLSIHGWNAIGELQLDRLKHIVESTKAKIVLSSSWRLSDDTKTLVQEALATKNLELIDATIEIRKKHSIVRRSEEILEWLTRHPEVVKFAILDDDSDAGFGIESHFFKTEFFEGLTWPIAHKVVEHLND